MDWATMIDAARNENAHGLEMRRGKKYTTVAIRVELMRRHAGALGIETEIVHWATEKGHPIVVKATVRDETGRVLATGHAEEIRGSNQVNTTSALENAETSAIGRAMASLGLSGGEFASANEMEAVDRKSVALVDSYDPAQDAAKIADAKTGKDLLAVIPIGHADHPAIRAAIVESLRRIVKGAQQAQVLDLLAERFAPVWADVAVDAQARRIELSQAA